MAGANVGTAYMSLVPKLADRSLKSIERKFTQSGKTAGGGYASAFTPAMKAGLLAGAAAAVTAVAAITKSAVANYAEYEQLIDGTKLMYGEAADYITQKAASAWKTVQLSQSEYLDTANFYATSLKESLGGNEQLAAETADRIIQTQADVVAATGADGQRVSDALMGVMRGNYTMLDNLQIGIKPTKEGMQEVIDKMNEWNASQGHATDYQMENYADMEMAISDYVDYVGMADYASAESADTISGSVASMQGAWDNFLTGLASDDADIEQLTNDLVESVTKVVENMLPVIGKVLLSLAKVGAKAVQDLAVAMVTGVAKLTYTLITKCGEMVSNAGRAISSRVGDFASAGADLVRGLVSGISPSALIDKAVELCSAFEKKVKSFFGIASPSKLMRRYGGFISEGLALGIGDGGKKAVRAADILGGKVAGAFGSSSMSLAAAGASYGRGDTYITLDYNAGADANQIVRDIGMALKRRSALGV